MSEVDEIENRLRDPVNSRLNGNQRRDFARLIVLARDAERLSRPLRSDTSEVRVYDRPPTPPVMRNG